MGGGGPQDAGQLPAADDVQDRVEGVAQHGALEVVERVKDDPEQQRGVHRHEEERTLFVRHGHPLGAGQQVDPVHLVAQEGALGGVVTPDHLDLDGEGVAVMFDELPGAEGFTGDRASRAGGGGLGRRGVGEGWASWN